MKALLQRVSWAEVEVAGAVVGSIGPGLLVLLGVEHGDTETDARSLADKTARLRIFSDHTGRFNLSSLDVGGAMLVVSQFTLMADTRRGRRPSFTNAAAPEEAESLIAVFCAALAELNVSVASGTFGAHMRVRLENDGPVTLMLQSTD